ncbi:MAG: hypothetical protein J0M17_22170 [Planctomycetes bacterium]|nr:hypothetical protein [Planctomycetota bacterium]
MDPNSTQVWLSRGQSREYLAAGRVVTGRVHAANGGLLRITYRDYVKVDASVGFGNDDNDRLHVILGPEQHQDFTPPVMLDANPLVRQSERSTLLRKIDQWNQEIELAKGHLVANGDALQQTNDPSLQALYSSAYQQWSARRSTLEAELLNLQFQLCVRQE